MPTIRRSNGNIYVGKVRSPSKNLTLKRLRELEKDNFYNPTTGYELSESESKTRINELLEAKSERYVMKSVAKLNRIKRRSRNREWIPKGKVVFRRINGRNVPFRKQADEPFL